jgi:hypothetical protein
LDNFPPGTSLARDDALFTPLQQMKISGFTMVRNAEKLYFPIKESILSVLPVVDEFIVALGDGDDNTRGLIESHWFGQNQDF